MPLAVTDADRRQLPDLKPVLKGLHAAAAALRAAAWNDDATGGQTPQSPCRQPRLTPDVRIRPRIVVTVGVDRERTS